MKRRAWWNLVRLSREWLVTGDTQASKQGAKRTPSTPGAGALHTAEEGRCLQRRGGLLNEFWCLNSDHPSGSHAAEGGTCWPALRAAALRWWLWKRARSTSSFSPFQATSFHPSQD